MLHPTGVEVDHCRGQTSPGGPGLEHIGSRGRKIVEPEDTDVLTLGWGCCRVGDGPIAQGDYDAPERTPQLCHGATGDHSGPDLESHLDNGVGTVGLYQLSQRVVAGLSELELEQTIRIETGDLERPVGIGLGPSRRHLADDRICGCFPFRRRRIGQLHRSVQDSDARSVWRCSHGSRHGDRRLLLAWTGGNIRPIRLGRSRVSPRRCVIGHRVEESHHHERGSQPDSQDRYETDEFRDRLADHRLLENETSSIDRGAGALPEQREPAFTHLAKIEALHPEAPRHSPVLTGLQSYVFLGDCHGETGTIGNRLQSDALLHIVMVAHHGSEFALTGLGHHRRSQSDGDALGLCDTDENFPSGDDKALSPLEDLDDDSVLSWRHPRGKRQPHRGVNGLARGELDNTRRLEPDQGADHANQNRGVIASTVRDANLELEGPTRNSVDAVGNLQMDRIGSGHHESPNGTMMSTDKA